VQTRQIRKRLACPFKFCQPGTGSGLSLFRLSAQACTAWWSMT
jgi:hypothetical protein